MSNKLIKLLLLGLSTICVMPMLATLDQELNEALITKHYLFSCKPSAIKQIRGKNTWHFQSGGITFFIKKGRPDTACNDWKNFVAKLTIGKNAKIQLGDGHLVIDEDADYTVFTKQKKQIVKHIEPLTIPQQELLGAVRQVNFITIVQLLENKDATPFKNEAVINQLLRMVWNRDYNIKMAASYVLGLLSKDKKLDTYVYRVWSEAADEQNYRYRTKPIYSGSCQSAIRQFGIYDIADGIKKGFVLATRMPEDNEGADAIFRKTMDEDFFIISGRGEFWTKDAQQERGPFVVSAGDYISNPAQMHIQFRNIGEEPLKIIVTTNPPFDHVIKKFPEDVDKEIHKAIGPWQFNQTINTIAEKISELGRTNKNKVRAILLDPNAQYLERLYAAKLFKNDFIAEKLSIAKNENEHWALRVAVIKSLQGNDSLQVIADLQILKEKTSGFIKKAIESALR